MLTKEKIEEIFERRGGFALAAEYPSKVCASYDYVSVGVGGVPSNISYTVRVYTDGRFELKFRPSWCFAEFKLGAMAGFENDERFASLNEQFSKGVYRLEGFSLE